MTWSMTGYGSAVGRSAGGEIVVHVKTVNHRALEVRFRGLHDPAAQVQWETMIRDRMERGTVDVTVDLPSSRRGQVNTELLARELSQWRDRLGQLIQGGALPQAPTTDWVLSAALAATREDGAVESIPPGLLESALDACMQARRTEGVALRAELLRLVNQMEQFVHVVAQGRAGEQAAQLEAIRARIAELGQAVPGLSLDAKSATDIAAWIVRGDVQEEIARLQSHFSTMRRLLDDDQARHGRQLAVLGQECQRESNTLLSKTGGGASKDAAVGLKLAVDQFREQVANVE